ncbi:MAG: ATP-binding protein [Trueperaceae bacterium]|nr:ATP-binding protein [Trueperaceae bacterium]
MSETGTGGNPGMSAADDGIASLLARLLDAWENEVVEFKRADRDIRTSDIGRYFSALANEANLRGASRAWLVFGVDDATRSVVGTQFRPDRGHLDSLKRQMADGTGPASTFREIYEHSDPAGRVLLFEIPPAPIGIPIAWNGHYFARAGETLAALGIDKLDEIRGQAGAGDWTHEVLPYASFADLDDEAVRHARESVAKKLANRTPRETVTGWPLETFLARARLTRDGQLTRAAVLLVGKPESAHLLSPHPAQLTWRLEGEERAYEHFGPPFLLTTSELYRRIRNIQIRLLPDNALLPIEQAKYDRKVVLEALHNAIAHQDFTRNGRVVVTEQPDRLVFENEGQFFEGQPDDYIPGTRTPRRYRNPFLTQAMAALNMIDTMGYGIHEMHKSQKERYLPLPDFDLSEAHMVRVTVHGRVVDPAYTRLLIEQTDLPLADVLALDRVQKGLPIDAQMARKLRQRGLVEGRRPKLHISARVAKASATKVDYIRTRAQDDAHYQKLVTDYLRKFGTASRKDIDALLWDKLSDALSDDQKANKIGNLLTKWRRNGVIFNAGSRPSPEWKLQEGDAE